MIDNPFVFYSTVFNDNEMEMDYYPYHDEFRQLNTVRTALIIISNLYILHPLVNLLLMIYNFLLVCRLLKENIICDELNKNDDARQFSRDSALGIISPGDFACLFIILLQLSFVFSLSLESLFYLLICLLVCHSFLAQFSVFICCQSIMIYIYFFLLPFIYCRILEQFK